MNKDNDVIYIGKTNDITRRIRREHFSKKGHLPDSCYSETEKVEFALIHNKSDMNLYETYYIKKLKPKYNSHHVDADKISFETEDLQWNIYNYDLSDEFLGLKPVRMSEMKMKPEGNESRGHNAVSNNILCHHDNKTCPLLSTIEENTDSRMYSKDEVTKVARGFAPCEYCPRYAACKVPNLSNIKMGSLNRRALMLAPVDDWLIVEPMDDSRAADEGNKRALRKLVKDGLVYGGFKWVTHEFTQKNSYHVTKRDYKRKAIKSTPLGKSVREFYAHELENGKAIRWNRYMDREYDFTETEAELLNRFGRTCKESARYYRYDVRYKMEYISELVNDLKAGN